MKKQLNSLNARLLGLRRTQCLDGRSKHTEEEEEEDEDPVCKRETRSQQVRCVCVCLYHITSHEICVLIADCSSEIF